MARRLKSPVRKIVNSGGHLKFIGIHPAEKSVDGKPLVFDSISTLRVQMYLDWKKLIASISFEPHKHKVEIDGVSFTSIPDIGATDIDGRFGYVEAKYDISRLTDEELARLDKCSRWYEREGYAYEVLDRKTLESNGLIQTIALLRRYRSLRYPPETLARAKRCLIHERAATLREHQERAKQRGVPLSILYVLLYRQELSLIFEKLVHAKVALCRR